MIATVASFLNLAGPDLIVIAVILAVLGIPSNQSMKPAALLVVVP